MRQTAVEWLESKFDEFETIYDSLPAGLYEYTQQAKEMEKQQIIDAFESGVYDGGENISQYSMDSKEYYNETFKK